MITSKFQEKLSKFLLPIAQKVEEQKHLQAIKDGMISIIPIIIIGSFSILPIAFINIVQSGAALVIWGYLLIQINSLMASYQFMQLTLSLNH